MIVILSTVILCVNTHPDLQVVLADGTKGENPTLIAIEKACVIWFTIEYIIRLVSCPDKKRFLKGAHNAVDFFAISPFYIGLFIELGSGGVSSNFKNIRRFDICEDIHIFHIACFVIHYSSLNQMTKISGDEGFGNLSK